MFKVFLEIKLFCYFKSIEKLLFVVIIKPFRIISYEKKCALKKYKNILEE